MKDIDLNVERRIEEMERYLNGMSQTIKGQKWFHSIAYTIYMCNLNN